MMILHTKPMPELHSNISISLEVQTLEISSQFWGMGGNPIVPNQDYREGDDESPSAKSSRGSHTLPCHGFFLTKVSQYSQWFPTHSCILHRKNTLQFALLPLPTLSVWSPSFNLYGTWVCCLCQQIFLPPHSMNIILTYITAPALRVSRAWQQNGNFISDFPSYIKQTCIAC